VTDDRVSLMPLFFTTSRQVRGVGAVFVMAAAVCWIAAGYDLGELRTLASSAGSLDATDRLVHERVGVWVAIAQGACAVLLAAAFLPWLHQVRANLRALGARRLRFRREWTYLGFAVPGLNLYRPYQVVSEIWRGSDPVTGNPLDWQHLRTSRLVLAWWVLLVAWLSLEGISTLLLEVTAGLARIQTAHAIGLAADVCGAASASLGYLLVVRISAAQDAKWSAHGHGGGAAAAAPRSYRGITLEPT
jgi:uncharacterized protein DUF4328